MRAQAVVDPMQVPIRGGQANPYRLTARRPTMTTSSSQTCYVALELSRAKWLVGALLPGRSKVLTTLVPGGDTAALLDVLHRLAARGTREVGPPLLSKDSFSS